MSRVSLLESILIKSAVDKEKALMLPAEPFLLWIRVLIQKNDGSLEAVGRILNISARRVQSFRDGFYFITRKGQEGSRVHHFKNISIDVVDRCFTAEGNTFLWDVYPHLYTFLDEVA